MFGSLGCARAGTSAMLCEKAMELVRELHRAAEGQLPAFNVRAGGRFPGSFSGVLSRSGRRVCPWFFAVAVATRGGP